MKNYLPLIATQILNIDLYSLFRIKGKEINAHGNQTYYLGYDGLHSTKDEINADPELLNKILMGKAEIIYLPNKNKMPHNTSVKNLEINAIGDRFKLGNLTLIEWRFIYYLIAKNINKNKNIIANFKEFEHIYNYSSNILTKEKLMLESLLAKKIIIDYEKMKDRQIQITFSDNLLYSIKNNNHKYKIKEIANFKHISSYLFYDYIISKLKKENFKIVELKITEFKKICTINKSYSRYEDLKNSIILPMLKDINNYIDKNKYGLRIFYDNIKESRTIVGIKFTIIRKEEP